MVAAPSPLQELAEAAEAAVAFQLRAEFTLADFRTLLVHLSGGHSVTPDRPPVSVYSWTLRTSEVMADDVTSSPDALVKSLGEAFGRVVARYPGAALRPDSVKISLMKGTTPASKVVPVAVRAWHEAYGLPIPSAGDLARMRKVDADARRSASVETIALLSTGHAGVVEFNKRPWSERANLDLRKADLSGLALGGVKFAGACLESAELSGASLSGASFGRSGAHGRLAKAKLVAADLTGATLTWCRCAGADFSRADLSRANANHGSFPRACFAGADLGDALFNRTDLCAADFTGATLTGAKLDKATFDDATKWPKGFKPPAEMTWKGAGADPRLVPTRREKTRSRPTDFAGFLNRLKLVADGSKLDKAMDMLKADRFRLFAKVEDDHVVGVVKSQSDGSLVYSCRLDADGTYACCTQNLNICGGLRGSPCKHLLVLIVGLAQAGELDPGTAHDWVHSSRGRKPALDKDVMTETFLRYKGAEAGEVDWRPTETIPEDFYAI